MDEAAPTQFDSMSAPGFQGLSGLSGFIEMMKQSDISGPFIQRRIHHGIPLGQGAQFHVYGAQHGAPRQSEFSYLDQPYRTEMRILRKGKLTLRPIYVAFKRPLPAKPSSDHQQDLPIGFGNSGQLRELQLEVLALGHKTLRSHRKIVTMLAWGFDLDPNPDGNVINPISPIIIVECANCSLRKFLMPENDSMPVEVRQKLCHDVCKAVSVLHHVAIIHGDIKTENVLIYAAETTELGCLAKLSDFGISISEEEGKSSSSKIRDSDIGTDGWQAPELLEGVYPCDLAKCDLFSLGLLVWSVMSSRGRSPLSESTPAESALDLAISFLETSGIPDVNKSQIESVLSSLLQNDPRERAPNIQAVCSNLAVQDPDYNRANSWYYSAFKLIN